MKCLLLLLCFSCFLVHSQVSVNSVGGDLFGSNGSVSYSIGQVAYTYDSSGLGSTSMGVQQPYEIFTLDLNENELSPSIVVFPNPTVNNLTLKVNIELYNMNYNLLSHSGELISSSSINQEQTLIRFDDLPSGLYLLNILESGRGNIKTFKIIKN